MFGVSCAPELFQKVMETIIAELEGVIVYLDDVVVSGRTQTVHDNRLEALLDRLESYNVLLNRDKCQFNVQVWIFLGHNLSVNGVRPVESRVSAVAKFREPANAAELRSFLGLVTYVGRFIPHLAAKIDPLRQLLRKGVTFQWTVKQQAAFDSIKEAVFQIKNLGFFDPKDVTILVADASPSGLGAVLMQEDSLKVRRVIAYASKSLTDLERKYFHTEKEALALNDGYSGCSPIVLKLCMNLGLRTLLMPYQDCQHPHQQHLTTEMNVIPKALQNRILELSHEGHPGIVVMKRRLRQKVWWPGMDKEVEKIVKGCKECILVSAQDSPEPLKRTTKPWAHIAADFMGPLPSCHNLLVLIDYFSRFIEVIIMREITAKLTVQALHETF
ncbi:uncharacterized protein K02A2.6-like [Wyeomyia smithii]|uniref:uncharacterized protein K02A2.6-like n=1 Tax=Wyeomyia smithii TaxID=174621 RepID=UPI002467B3BF|nr:uncharacterized protein K02A2.6-like [Wyeomyia smithii]